MEDQAALVDIVIPVYNVEAYLRQCVDSVLAQNYPAITITLVDDGSTDGSGHICDEYAQKDARVRVVHQQNKGLSGARNAGLALAGGEYIYFLDSDDYIVPDAIETLVRAAEAAGADFVFFDGVNFLDGENESPLPRQQYIRRKDYGQGSGPAMLTALRAGLEYRCSVPLLFMRRAALADGQLSFYEGILHEDTLFTFLLFMRSDVVVHVHKALFYRRLRRGSITQNQKTAGHFIGYYTAFSEMVAYYRGAAQTGAHPEVIKASIRAMFRNACGTYYKLPKKDKIAVEAQKNEMLRVAKALQASPGLWSRIRYSPRCFPLMARVFVWEAEFLPGKMR